jgi:hypothetical protein
MNPSLPPIHASRCGDGCTSRQISQLGVSRKIPSVPRSAPSALNTRRTVVCEAPIPKRRRITSRMRRLPARGSAFRVARIAFARSSGGFLRFGCSAGFLRLAHLRRPRASPACTFAVLIPRFARLAFCLHVSTPSLLLAQQRARQVLTDYANIPSRN